MNGFDAAVLAAPSDGVGSESGEWFHTLRLLHPQMEMESESGEWF